MVLLDVKNVRKVYTTRFGGNQVEALKDVNFSVEQGEYVAIMGESGSGKSTLLNILAALDKPTEGKVFLKEKDLSKVKEKEMAAFRRNNLGFVFQDFNLLDTFSLKDNIFLPLVLSGTSYREMERRLLPLADKLGIKNLLEKYPYEVSGGQKQRVVISRAFLNNSNIIIFDDTFSALDNRTEQHVLSNIKELTKNKTCIIVSNRISDIKDCDKIIVLEDGVSVGMGTHKELLKNCDVYKEIALSQLSKEELENAE